MPFKSEKQRKFMFANEPEIAKKWAKEYNQGGVASMFRKKLEDGDLSPEIISQIESMAATGVDASTISTLVGVSEEQVNNVLMSGSTSEVMPVEGEEMVETAEVTEEADPLLNLFQQNDSLNNDQSMTTLFNTAENPVNANMTGQPVGIMAARGGRIGFQGGGRDAGKDSDFGSENFGNNNNNNNNNNDNSGPVYSPHTDTPEQIAGQKEIDDDKAERDFDYESNAYEKDLLRPQQIKTLQIMDKYENKITPTYKDKYNELKEAVKLGKNVMGANSSLLGFLGAGYALFDAYKKDKAFVEGLNKDISTLKDMGVADFHHTVDTPVQTLEQLMTDRLNSRINKDDGDGDGDGIQPYVSPVTLEVDEEFAQGENININMSSALDKIRANQARRSGAVATGNIQDNEIMMANRGGLAGLFRVKNQ